MSKLLNALLLVVTAGCLWVASGRAIDNQFQASVREPVSPPAWGPAERDAADVRASASVSSVSSATRTREPASLNRRVSVWIRMADCESGDGDGLPPYRADWTYNGLHDGGLQFLPSTWNAAKRLSEVRRVAAGYGYAYHAPARVQILVADNWRRHTSWAQWPTCSRKLGLR